MAVDPLDIEIDDRELNPKPTYISKDRKERESFLSQVGNFTTEEREIFNLLCDNWDHEIGYAKFVTKINKKHPIEEKYIESLMKKMIESRCGILLTKFIRGERGADKIILTEPDSHFFYYYFINNEYQKNHQDISLDFVDDSVFETYNINTSIISPMSLNIESLNKSFINKELNQTNIYSVVIDGYKNFYATSETLQDLLKLSVRKVKYYFKSDNFIAFIAKIMNTSISSIRSTVDHFDISTWKNLTVEIIKNKKIINGKFKNISNSFFKSVSIVTFYCFSELEQKDKELEDEKRLKVLLKEISEKIREKEFTPFTQEAFNSLFDEFKEESTVLKSKFYENFVDNKTKTGLTEIVFVGKCYIHQDNLYKVFLDQIAQATSELSEIFKSEFKTCLLSNSPDPSLFIGFPFESSIQNALKTKYPIIHDLLNRKSILAESIIHFSKKRSHSQGKMHNLLSMYFKEGTSELRSIDTILSLNVHDIFDSAYMNLSNFKRFFIFVFGQYNSYVERFTGYRKSKNKDIKKKNNLNNRSSNYRSSLNTNYDSHTAINYPSTGKRLLKKDVSQTPKRKIYNKEQIDSAWNNLGTELSKKKK